MLTRAFDNYLDKSALDYNRNKSITFIEFYCLLVIKCNKNVPNIITHTILTFLLKLKSYNYIVYHSRKLQESDFLSKRKFKTIYSSAKRAFLIDINNKLYSYGNKNSDTLRIIAKDIEESKLSINHDSFFKNKDIQLVSNDNSSLENVFILTRNNKLFCFENNDYKYPTNINIRNINYKATNNTNMLWM